MDTQLAILLDLYQDTLEQLVSDVQGLTEAQGELPTDCAGWTVKDQISHVVGLDQSLSGSSEPTVTVPDYDHVEGNVAVYMETHVEARRGLPLQASIDELVGLAPRRLAQLKAQIAQGDIEIPSAFGGTSKLSESLPIRILDVFAHELDIARALGRTPRTSGPVADAVIKQTFGAWSGLLPRRLSDVGTITLGTTAPHEFHRTIELGNSELSASIIASRDTMLKLGMGRGNLQDVLAEATTSGDPSVIDAVAPMLAFTP